MEEPKIKYGRGKNPNSHTKVGNRNKIGLEFRIKGNTPEARARAVATRKKKGQWHSEDTARKISETMKRKYKEGYMHPCSGRVVSKVQRINHSEIMKEKYKSGYTHPKGMLGIEIVDGLGEKIQSSSELIKKWKN